MNSNVIDSIKNCYKNPIAVCGLAVVILSLILLFGCHFQLPEFYTDKQLAENIAQTAASGDVYNSVRHLLNPEYGIFNIIFQVWGYSVVIFCFLLIFKIKTFKNFKELTVLNKKPFVYLWINGSYLIWSFLYTSACMTDLEKYVYNGSSDSIGIALFTIITMLVFIGIIYYPLINILSFITFNTKIKRIFYNIIWALILVFWLVFIATDTFTWKFTYLHLLLDFFYFVWFIFIIYAIGYTKNKNLT